MPTSNERRKYTRYDTEMRVFFRVQYDLRTKITFEIANPGLKKQKRRYAGFTKNISAEGLCFVSRHTLAVGDVLLVDIYTPNTKQPVCMRGEVRWCQLFAQDEKYKNLYHTGIRLLMVGDVPVQQTIYHDETYNVIWSAALEAVFGNFAALSRAHKHTQ